MGIPVGVQYKASAVDLCDVRDTCGACDAERRASVLVVAHGTASAPLFLFPQHARSAAAEQAVDAIPEVARILPLIARCPSCGERDPEIARARRLGHALRWAWGALPIAIMILIAEALIVAVWWKLPVSPAAVGAAAVACWALIVVAGTMRAIRRDHAIAEKQVEWTRVRARGEKKWKKLGGEWKID